MQNAPREHSAILLTFIKLPFVFKTFVLSMFEWPLKIGFTVDHMAPQQYLTCNSEDENNINISFSKDIVLNICCMSV